MKDIPAIIVMLVLIGISYLVGASKRRKKRQQEV